MRFLYKASPLLTQFSRIIALLFIAENVFISQNLQDVTRLTLYASYSNYLFLS